MIYPVNAYQQDTEHLHPPRKLPHVPSKSIPGLTLEATIYPTSLPEVSFTCSRITYKWFQMVYSGFFFWFNFSFALRNVLRFIHVVYFCYLFLFIAD